ncbi:leucine-rich repeat-containing protein 40 [Patella vulgata]|uniref:leucine-rich repeat-containing protein 40 n=1 Tax=Patella vulgata TaxID=6465 RepID=UPI0021801713|nr:leucine-rich repeat-containing protein 40 [Patella vulgata]
MTSRGRGARVPFNKSAFRQQNEKENSSDGVPSAILKQARQSGQLNLSGRGLATVPDKVWRINIDVPEEAKNVSLDNAENRWWDQVDLTKLILASNTLTAIPDDISNFPALTVLDIHDNNLESLPAAFKALENLQKLDVSRNKLKVLPSSIGYLRTLVSLHVEHNQLTQLCEEIKCLQKIEDLDVSNNQLTVLPTALGYLVNLVKLNVSNNKIKSLPPEIGDMSGLKYFDATHNELTLLPQEFGNLRKLELLYLRHNKLAYLPVLENCVSLKELHVGNNNIMGITSEHLQHLTSINVLDLRDNKISKLPDEITLLQSLQRLDITNNDLSSLPYCLGTIVSLKSLVLEGNPMKSIRRDIIMRGTVELKKYLSSRIEEPVSNENNMATGGNTGIIGGNQSVSSHEMCQMKTLDYSQKQASEIPADILEAAQKADVTVVNLHKNIFTDLPSNLRLLSDTVTELHLNWNKISTLSSEISAFKRLVCLDLGNNMLTDLPKEISSLQNIREIIISRNRFTVIPSVVFELKKLEILFASDNKIEVIDVDGLKRLPVLATLDLQNNNISQVPPELGNCPLKSLQIAGNLFRNPRPAILAKGTPTLLEHLRSRIVT